MQYEHFGWLVSPYSAKTRAYLRYKKIPFEDIEIGAVRLFTMVKRAVGRPVMPTVRRSDGTWMQDTSEIIDTLERDHPEPTVTPAGPCQRVASALLELHADEWLPIVAMYTRWTIPENREFAVDEFARSGFPRVPRTIGRRLIRPVANKMAAYLPILGVHAHTRAGISNFAEQLIAQLNRHFSQHPFLLGTRPCLGDFAMYGPLWAHCYRDPGSRYLFADAPEVVAWFQRLARPPDEIGAFLPDDRVPETLDPIFAVLFAEQWSYIRKLVTAIDRYLQGHPEARRVPRALGDCEFTIGGASGQRRLITFTQWMAQRPLDVYTNLSADERVQVNAWLGRVGASGALDLEVCNRLERHNFKMRVAARV